MCKYFQHFVFESIEHGVQSDVVLTFTLMIPQGSHSLYFSFNIVQKKGNFCNPMK